MGKGEQLRHVEVLGAESAGSKAKSPFQANWLLVLHCFKTVPALLPLGLLHHHPSAHSRALSGALTAASLQGGCCQGMQAICCLLSTFACTQQTPFDRLSSYSCNPPSRNMCLQTTKPPARTRRLRTAPGAATLAEDEQQGSADSSYSSAADRRRSVSSRRRTRGGSPGSSRVARRTFQELTEVRHSWRTTALAVQGHREVP